MHSVMSKKDIPYPKNRQKQLKYGKKRHVIPQKRHVFKEGYEGQRGGKEVTKVAIKVAKRWQEVAKR